MKFKRLIPALAMLLVSAILLGTSTFAWFSMNTSVSATGMEISVKSNSVFLLIGDETKTTAASIQAVNTITTTLTADAELYPAAHDAIADTDDAIDTTVSNLKEYALSSDTTQKISIDAYNNLSSTDKALYETVNADGTNWYYRIADAVTASTSTKQINYLATLDANYVIHKTCYITLAAGSNDATNLKVSGMSITSNASYTDNPDTDSIAATFAPVKVLITTDAAAVELDSTTTSSNTALAATVTDDDVVQVDIFIYYNGNDTNVFTNNVANLDGANISLTFSVD